MVCCWSFWWKGGGGTEGAAHLSQRDLSPFGTPANSKLTASFAEAALVVIYYRKCSNIMNM